VVESSMRNWMLFPSLKRADVAGSTTNDDSNNTTSNTPTTEAHFPFTALTSVTS
jgi:hypothetical protein